MAQRRIPGMLKTRWLTPVVLGSIAGVLAGLYGWAPRRAPVDASLTTDDQPAAGAPPPAMAPAASQDSPAIIRIPAEAETPSDTLAAAARGAGARADFTETAHISPPPRHLPATEPSVPRREVTERVRLPLGYGARDAYATRLRAVRELPRDLLDVEVSALCGLIVARVDIAGLSIEQFNGLRNEIVNVLKSQRVPPEHLADHLMAAYRDGQQHEAWRDYCIQHLGSWLDVANPGEPRSRIEDALWQATSETHSSIGGTALLALARNVEQGLVSRDRLADRALALVRDPGCGRPTRITALQVCAALSDARVLPDARRLAESGERAMVRMSALAAIGSLGDAGDAAMLNKYAQSSDVRLRKAAREALRRLGAHAL